MSNYFLKVWGIPIVLAILTLIGLLSALIGSEAWHFVSWICLSIPLVVIVWHRGKVKR